MEDTFNKSCDMKRKKEEERERKKACFIPENPMTTHLYIGKLDA